MTKELDEIRFGTWWAIDYWLKRTENDYDEIQKMEQMYVNMFGEPNNNDKYGTWQAQANQLSKESKRLMK